MIIAKAGLGATMHCVGKKLDFWGLSLQFVSIFIIVGLVSLIATGLCALLKWEDERARAKEKPSE